MCGEPDLAAKGEEAQRRSLVLVSEQEGADPVAGPVFVDGISAAAAAAAGLEVVDDIEAAPAVLVRVDAPFEPGRGSLLAEYFRGGSLEFSADVLERLRGYARHAPVHVAVFLERPAVLTPLVEFATTVIGDFGASDVVVIDALVGRAALTGTLPFDIPRSMAAVEASCENVPFDTEDPLFSAESGLQRGITAPLKSAVG